MARFSLHAVGKDRPGIIAGIAHALAAMGANLEDSRMTILRGQFAVMLVLDAPGISDGGLIEGALEATAEELNLFIGVRPLPDAVEAPQVGERYSILVDGADRPGIVAGVAEAILGLGGNVIELSSRLLAHEGQSGYVLRLSIALPVAVSGAALEQAISEVSATLGVTSSVTLGSGDLA
jgi:glycine cleavage system transcriptional repressor